MKVRENITANLPLAGICAKTNYHWYVVATVCIGAFMAALDGSIITVALPTITRQFHVTLSATAWVALAYLLTLTALLTVFGRIADLVGRRPLYTMGFGIFIVGSALCGAAQSLPFLIGARVLQAVGAVMLQANSVAIITAAVPSSVRGKAIGIQGSALAVGLSLGPAIGGLLISAFGWRSIFYVNVPVGLIGTTLAALILPLDQEKDQATRGVSFDYLGSLLLAVSIVSVILGLNQGNEKGFGSPYILSLFACGILSSALFIWQEKRHRAPLVDLSLFKIPTLTWGNVSGSLSYALMYGILYIIPFYFEEVRKNPSSLSGLLTTPLPIGMMLLAPMAGRIADRLGSRIPTVAGMTLATLGGLSLLLLSSTEPLVWIIIALLIIGMGMGVFTPPNNSSVMGSSPRNRLGVTSGLLNMSRSLGQSFGIAFAFALYQGVVLAEGYSPLSAPARILLPGFHIAFAGVTALGLMAALISMFRGKVQPLADADREHTIEL